MRHLPPVLRLLVATLLLPLSACVRGDGPPTGIVVITLDTTRADALGAYGQRRPTTPRIDALARDGVLFENAVSPAPNTLPAHATLFTARQPFAHGVRSNVGFRLLDEQVTLAERLREAGWRTAAFVAAPVMAASRGLDQGFERYDLPELGVGEALEGLAAGLRAVRHSRPAEEITEAGLGFLREVGDAPFLAWLHYFDPHLPLEPVEPFASRFRDDYFAEVARVDAAVGRVIDELEALGLRERTTVVVTADHGEGRGDHGEETHGYFVYESTMRIPLVFQGAGVPRGVRVPALVRLADVAPTLLELAGLPPLEGVQGRSLVPLFRAPERDPGLLAYGESIEMMTTFGGDPLRFVREGSLKYVHKLDPALYDLESDPGEQLDLAERRPEEAARLRERLEAMLREAGAAPRGGHGELAPDEVAQLRALGYAGATADEEALDRLERLELEGPDPVERTRDLSVYVGAVAQAVTGRAAEAERSFRWLLARNPDSELVRGGLIEALISLGRHEEALPLLRRQLEAEPNDVGSLLNLAVVQQELGRPDEAERRLREALALDPCLEGARVRLSEQLRAQGRGAEQRAVLEEGLPCEPGLEVRNALAFLLATSPQAALRDGPRAVALAESVVEQGGGDNPDHLDTLAAAFAETGDFERAVATQRRALAGAHRRGLPPRLVDFLARHLAELEAGRPIRKR